MTLPAVGDRPQPPPGGLPSLSGAANAVQRGAILWGRCRCPIAGGGGGGLDEHVGHRWGHFSFLDPILMLAVSEDSR